MSRDKSLTQTGSNNIAAKTQQKDWAKKLENLSGEKLGLSDSRRYTSSVGVGIVYLVIDCSGSMNGNKLQDAINGGKGFADEAQTRGYTLGLIQFDSAAKHILEPQKEITVFYSSIEKLTTGGSTNMAAGIEMAIKSLAETPKSEKVICIVTDGQPDDRNSTLRVAEEAKRHGIEIMTIGTDDADKEFLEKLATKKELCVKVASAQLKQGIASMAKMLPSKT